MNIPLTPELEAALHQLAVQKGVSLQELALEALRERFLAGTAPAEPSSQWEQIVLGIGSDCGVSLPHSTLSSEGLYD